MKKFILGMIVGFLLGGTGVYTIVAQKAKEVATSENVVKTASATQNFINEVKKIFK